MGHLDTQNRALEMQGKICKPRYNKKQVQILRNKLTFVNSGLWPKDPENIHLHYLATESHIYIITLYCWKTEYLSELWNVIP
jgi:hypothetical protein